MVYDSIIISTGPAGITATLSTFEYLSKKSNLRQNPLIIDKTAWKYNTTLYLQKQIDREILIKKI